MNHKKNRSLKKQKNYENEYIDVIKTLGKYEDKFLKQINECISGMKNISLELTDKIKDTIILFSSSIKDSFKVPLDVIDSNLKNLTSTNIKENMDKAIIKTFNNEQKFTNIVPVKYELKSLVIVDNIESRFSFDSKGSKGNKKNKKKKKKEEFTKGGMVRFEDGFEEMTYFEDDCTLYTAEEIFNNFDLIITNGLNIKVELDKNITKNLISKILTNMQESSKDELNESNKISANEISQLKTLLNVHSNRVIFLHKLNDYRALCLYELQDYYYKLFGDLFSHIINVSVKENDYHSVEMVIILSKTYYILLEEKNKLYLQNVIENND